MSLKVFLSYAREDQAQVEEYYDLLLAERFKPWMDVKKILPGQNWEHEIDRALKEANVIIAWLSNNSSVGWVAVFLATQHSVNRPNWCFTGNRAIVCCNI
jgi:hypothetical protein